MVVEPLHNEKIYGERNDGWRKRVDSAIRQRKANRESINIME